MFYFDACTSSSGSCSPSLKSQFISVKYLNTVQQTQALSPLGNSAFHFYQCDDPRQPVLQTHELSCLGKKKKSLGFKILENLQGPAELTQQMEVQ